MANERKDIENIIQHSKNGDKIENIMRFVNKETLKLQHEKQILGKTKGIDKIDKEEYSKDLENKLAKLVSKMKTFSYKPKPLQNLK